MAHRKPSSIVVCDAGPLIHLDELHSLDLLHMFQEILVPERVWQEVQQHRSSALRRRNVRLTRIRDVPDMTTSVAALVRTHALDAGENEAFRIMERYPTATLLTDDGSARAAAEEMGYRYQGTVGTILEAFRVGLKTRRQTLNLLQAAPSRSSLHVSKSFLESVIAQVRESPL